MPFYRKGEQREATARTIAETDDADDAEDRRLTDELLRKHKAIVRGERQHRLAGRVVAADYALRLLTHIELIMAIGGQAQAMIDDATGIDPTGAPTGPKPYADPVSDLLGDIRESAWAEIGDPPRPSAWRPARYWPGSLTAGGGERAAAQRARRRESPRVRPSGKQRRRRRGGGRGVRRQTVDVHSGFAHRSVAFAS